MDVKELFPYTFLRLRRKPVHPCLNFVGAASPRSSSFVTFASLGYPSGGDGPPARLCFNLNIHAGRQIQLRQRIHRPRRRRIDVQQPLVRMQLELLTSLLIDVRRTKYREDLLTRRQRNRTRDHRAGTTDGFNDLFGRFIHQIVIVRLQFDSDSLRHKPIPIFRWGCKGMYYVSYYPKNQGFFFAR